MTDPCCPICRGTGWRDVQEEHNGKQVWVCVPCECLVGQTMGRGKRKPGFAERNLEGSDGGPMPKNRQRADLDG